jgi:hypothetical protein
LNKKKLKVQKKEVLSIQGYAILYNEIIPLTTSLGVSEEG